MASKEAIIAKAKEAITEFDDDAAEAVTLPKLTLILIKKQPTYWTPIEKLKD
jgi:hypothetical protein